MVDYQGKTPKAGLKKEITAGVDEVGRGPLAGPVVACACVLPNPHTIQGIHDSKKLSKKERENVYQTLVSHNQVAYGVGVVSVEMIDRLNILQAVLLAMKIALEHLPIQPDVALIDGNQPIPNLEIPQKTIIGGDGEIEEIGAASILAKVIRDEMMEKLHAIWPMYGFKDNKGYGTQEHRRALLEHGPCTEHRRSFEPVKSMVNFKRG